MASVSSCLGETARLNHWVRLSGFVVGALLPFILYFSTKAATLFVGVAAVMAAYGCWAGGFWPELRLRLPRRSPVAILAVLFVGYALASLGWSLYPRVVVMAWLEAAVALAASIALVVAYRALLPYRFGFGIAIGLIAAASYALLEFRLGMKLRGMAGIRAEAFVFNRSMVYQVLLLWPMFLLIEPKWRWLGAVAFGFVAVAAGVSDSAAAVFGLGVGLLSAGLAMIAPRIAPVAMSLGVVLYTLLAPWVGKIAPSVTALGNFRWFQGAHAQERIEIWRAFGDFYWQNPLFGIGFGASSKAQSHPAAAAVAESLQAELGASHPHNAFLQVWVELGVIGAALFAALCVLILMSVSRLAPRMRPIALGLAGSVLAIAGVSHGAWQPWWLTTVGLFAGIVWATQDGE